MTQGLRVQVLTKKNEDAAQIAGLLLRKGLRAKLIQSNDRFNLYDLQEIRYFVEQLYSEFYTPKISDGKWSMLNRSYKRSMGRVPKLKLLIDLSKILRKQINPADINRFRFVYKRIQT